MQVRPNPSLTTEHDGTMAVAGKPGASFFAVLDGHAGPTVAKIAAQALLPEVLSAEAGMNGDGSAVYDSNTTHRAFSVENAYAVAESQHPVYLPTKWHVGRALVRGLCWYRS